MRLWNRWRNYFDLSARKLGFRPDYSSPEARTIGETAETFGISRAEALAVYEALVYVSMTTGPYARKTALPVLLFISVQIFQPGLLFEFGWLNNVLGGALLVLVLVMSMWDWRSPRVAYSKLLVNAYKALIDISQLGRSRKIQAEVDNKWRARIVHAASYVRRDIRKAAWVIASEMTFLQTGSRSLIAPQLRNTYARAINNGAQWRPNDRMSTEEAKRACVELIKNLSSKTPDRLIYVEFSTRAPNLVPRRAWKVMAVIRPLMVPVSVAVISAVVAAALRIIVK
ncbi:hypothetical protein ABZX92_28050 [Lentzea sp. NPDC006480]|uniref:hypothetical protein n=1 Tax=Lentzea sp. NPDC006480 TaxID=3157176 RepID=UPI0033B1AC86